LLLSAAKRDFPAVVGGLSIAAIDEVVTMGGAKQLHDMEKFWTIAAAFADVQLHPTWLDNIVTDKEFFDHLDEEIRAQDRGVTVALGLFDPIKAAADKLAGGVTELVNSPIARATREKLTPKVAIFMGDVFEYLKAGSARTSIRATVMTAIAEAAHKSKATNEKLILAGHSMGGVILYDLLSDRGVVAQLSAALGCDLKIDLLLTVGSQVALFEELKVYTSSTAAYPATIPKVPMPPSVANWWNVFNKLDVLSFATEPVFQGPIDWAVDTSAGVLDAHSAYFANMLFYFRLNARLKTGGLLI